MKKTLCALGLVLLLAVAAVNAATYYAASGQCNTFAGTVISAENNEIFTIDICGTSRTYREFSYCYGVEAGEKVIFDSDPLACETVSFTAFSNSVQCGVLCL